MQKYCRAGNASDKNYGACSLHAEYVSLQTHTRYVMHIAFPLQQWLHKSASILRYTYIACLVLTHTNLTPASLYKNDFGSLVDFWLLGCLVVHVLPTRMRGIAQRVLLTYQCRWLCRHCSCQPSLNT